MAHSYCWKSTDVIAYVRDDGTVLCKGCYDEAIEDNKSGNENLYVSGLDEAYPICAGEEVQSKMSCEFCGENIEPLSIIDDYGKEEEDE